MPSSNEKPKLHIVRGGGPEEKPDEPQVVIPEGSAPPPKPERVDSARSGSKRKDRIAELTDRLTVQMYRAHEVLQGREPAAAIAGWEAQTEVLLQETLGYSHTYCHKFRMAMINIDKAAAVRAAYTVLQAIYEDAAAGRLRRSDF